MANQLETDILNMLYPHKDHLPWEDIKAQITIILNEYSIDKKCTEVAIRSEDTNFDICEIAEPYREQFEKALKLVNEAVIFSAKGGEWYGRCIMGV